jgi:hypothetical protein
MEDIHFCTCKHWETTWKKMESHMEHKHGYKTSACERDLWHVTMFLEKYKKDWKLVAR